MKEGAAVTVKDIFGLTIRIGGLVLIVLSLMDVIGVVWHLIGISPHQDITTWQVAAAAISYFVPGALLIFFADPIARLAYGSRK